VLNFIICDDEKEFRGMIDKEIEKFMMNYDVNYKVYQFETYDEEFEKALQKLRQALSDKQSFINRVKKVVNEMK